MPDLRWLMLGGQIPVFLTWPKLESGVKARNQGGTRLML